MPSEFELDLCFVQRAGESRAFYPDIERELQRMFGGSARWSMTRKTEAQTDIATVEINGLTAASTEEEALEELERRMTSDCWNRLGGYRLQVIPKEDAGPCRLHKKAR